MRLPDASAIVWWNRSLRPATARVGIGEILFLVDDLLECCQVTRPLHANRVAGRWCNPWNAPSKFFSS